MTREEKKDLIEELEYILATINAELKNKKANTGLRIKREKIKRKIKELKYTLTDNDWKELMKSGEIDVRKIND